MDKALGVPLVVVLVLSLVVEFLPEGEEDDEDEKFGCGCAAKD